MTKQEFAGVARAVLAAGAAWGTAKGWFVGLDSETLQGLIVAATTVAVSLWSVRGKRSAG